MQLPRLSFQKYRQFFYALIIILPSLLTGSVYQATYTSVSSVALLDTLAAMTSSLSSSLSDTENYTAYRLQLLLSNEAFTSFDKEAMGQHASTFVYRTPHIKNIYILNADQQLVYGVDDTALSGVTSTPFIDRAYEGSVGFYSAIIDNEPFAQFAVPIYSDTPIPTIRGVMCLTYNFEPLKRQFESLNSSSVDLEVFLFDASGNVLITSSPKSAHMPSQNFDIDYLKQYLTYLPGEPFILFDETPVIGKLYTLFDNGWTLLVTSPSPEATSPLLTQFISLMNGLLGVGGAIFIKSRDKTALAPETDSDEASDSTS